MKTISFLTFALPLPWSDLSSLLSYVQTDATTSNIARPTILGVVASVLAVRCKRMQQLPTMLGPAVHRGKETTHKTLETMCEMHVGGPNNFGRAVQTDPTLRYASAITKQKKRWVSWLKSLSVSNFAQQHATTSNRVCKGMQHVISNNFGSYWPTMFRQFAQSFRDLKIQGRWRQRKHRLKSECTFFQSLSPFFQLIYFVKCRRILQELNS